MKTSGISFGLLASAATGAYGWGAQGHHAVGYIAQQFLGPVALKFVQNSLGPTYNYSLGPAATWADEIKSNHNYDWAGNLHFVDAEDEPPQTCNVDPERDCANGVCILAAIANYTERVADEWLDATQRQEALKFLDHFIGDLSQPLHIEALGLGGNTVNATCNGKKTNLHSVWDTNMIEHMLSLSYNNSITAWADALSARIRFGTYSFQAAQWLHCSDPTPKCTLVAAREANTFDCSLVFNFTAGQDLCTTEYFIAAAPVIESQIAKSGYRLAAWLNSLFDGAPLLV